MINFWVASKSMFRTSKDGQKLFYPNGYLGAGYIIPSDEVYKRLLRGYIVMCIAAVVLMVLGALAAVFIHVDIYIAIIVVVGIYLIAYMSWVHISTRDLVKVSKT